MRESVREAAVVPLTDVSADDEARCRTGIGELDRVLGGGIVSRFACACRRRSGDWKIHAAASGMPADGRDEENFIYIGRRVAVADQTQSKPDGKIFLPIFCFCVRQIWKPYRV